MRRLLFIAYNFPPAGGVPVRRALRLSRHLPDSDWSVSVLTADRPYDPFHPGDPSGLETLPPLEQILRTPARSSSERSYARIFEGIRRVRALTSGASSNGGADMVGVRLRRLLYETLACPDPKRSWISGAVRAGLNSHAERPFDAILATGYPWSSLVVAARLGERTRIPVVLDYRDSWTLSPRRLWTGLRNRRLEARVLGAAAAVTTVTEEMTRQLRAAYPWFPAERIITVPNGVDPDEFPDPDPSLADPKHLILTYTGSFNDVVPPSPYDRTPYFLIRAIERLDPALRSALRVRFVGVLGERYRNFIRDRGVEDVIDLVGPQTYQRSLQHQRAADLLLLVIYDNPGARADMTGKLVEYMAAQRPILALVPDGEAAKLIQNHNLGWVVPPADVAEITEKLGSLVGAWRRGNLASRAPAIPELTAHTMARRLAAILDRVVRAPVEADSSAARSPA